MLRYSLLFILLLVRLVELLLSCLLVSVRHLKNVLKRRVDMTQTPELEQTNPLESIRILKIPRKLLAPWKRNP